MPTSIPYDPSLTLMSLVTEQAVDTVKEIADLQAPVDAAQDALNSLISTKRSLTMTKTELKNLGVPTYDLDKEIKKLDATIEKAAADYAKAKIVAEPQVIEKRKKIHSAHKQIESPVDDLRSEIKNMPLANDSMNMDVQYFSFDSNSQTSAAYSAQIASYVSASVGGVFGPKQSMEMGAAASRQVSRQISQQSTNGTLVLSVSCTHKNATIVAPFVLHVDKAIKVWNHLFPEIKLDLTSGSSMMKCAMNESQEDKKKFSIISGTTFGSCFVGMIHVLNMANTSASESMTAAATSMQASMDTGSWFAKKSGKVGVDPKFASDVKNRLSQQNIQSHVTVLSMGVTPSMVPSEVSRAVEKFANFDPKVNMAGIQNTSTSDQASVQSFAENARNSGQVSEIQGKTVESTMSAITAIEDNENKVLDVNCMMTALDDYLKKAAEGTSGVPINYYLKDIYQKMLAQMWAAKYYPGKFMSIKYDDTEGGGLATENGEHKDKL
ncbi:uncharacterized protein B0J16DRAFT_405613 [Fusarium flagelliforme]|uniref:Uncharacterized protein n=1 Tax=Fusarium flagelliforme TaxID=2675880 RepID=A0A395MSX0_9HYPO|nr:uncharacterized protein B0J16DRAFT_405613 [Fusarium flagelliforme]KAH7173250.1 hypothetical protein B0J16DRAFT_405613 [Fusarium flagelliforme]RFN50797.1 hypothetical protein FIE12Z_5035 [Fusarium flagelliforme]